MFFAPYYNASNHNASNPDFLDYLISQMNGSSVTPPATPIEAPVLSLSSSNRNVTISENPDSYSESELESLITSFMGDYNLTFAGYRDAVNVYFVGY